MKLRRWLALICVCVWLCSAISMSVSAAADTYPLKNGDFETGTTAQWQAQKGVAVSTAAKYEGRYGCLITGDGDWDDLLSQTFSVLPGYTYTITFWYKAQPMGVSWYLFEGKDQIRLYRGWAGQTEWTKVAVDFTPSKDTVQLLFRGSGSHAAEKVYLDSVLITLNPCTVHTYDNPCDTTCNVCDYVRKVGAHVYDYSCDVYCNHCGYERQSSGKHTYPFACATLCSYCGAPRVGESAHTYSGVCATSCNLCGEIREVAHFYDDIYDADCNQCGHVRIPTPKPIERLFAAGASCSSDVKGVAFRFVLEAHNGRVNADNSYVRRSANVYRYNNGEAYKLIRVGAVMSNKDDAILELEHVDNNRIIDVTAGYLCDITANTLSFAVRIINIPTIGYNTIIRARPYYVYSDGKQEILVYGETASQSYNGLAKT